MPAKTINNMPDEVLLHIFDMLDGKTLKICFSVQSRWNFFFEMFK